MKVGIKYFIYSIGILSLCGEDIHAQSRIYVNEYLNIGVGGRGLSMSGAQVASTSDIFSAYWNPAGLVSMKNHMQFGGMHAEYFGGISKYDYVGWGIKNKSQTRALGFSFIRFATDDIPYTLDYVRPDGSFDESKLKGFSAADMAGLITISQKLQPLSNEDKGIFTTVGANAKVLYRHVGSMANAWGVGIDLGIQTRHKKFLYGLTLKDATSTYTSWSFNLTDEEKKIFGQTGNEIPIKSYEVMNPRLNLGVGYNVFENDEWNVLAELGVDMTTDGQRKTILSSKMVSFDPKFGFEVGYKEMVYLRGGVSNFYYVHDNDDIENKDKYLMYQPSIGVGINIYGINVDYSFTSLQVQNNPLMSHIISLRIDLNKVEKKDKVPEVKKTEPNSQEVPPLTQ